MLQKIVLCLATLFTLCGCGEDSDTTRSNDFIPLTSIDISSEYPQIANLTVNQFTATGNFSDVYDTEITAEVVWSSSDETILVISNDSDTAGLATALDSGEVTVTATSTSEGLSATYDFEVTDAVLSTLTISPLLPSVAAGYTRQFSASGTFDDNTTQNISSVVDWTSSDETVVTIDSSGLATAISSGTATISANFSGESASTEFTVTDAVFASLKVTPSDLERPAGLVLQYTATATMSDGTSEDVTEDSYWESSSESVATVSNDSGSAGEVETLDDGDTTITATYNDEEATADLEVNSETLDSLEISPEDDTIDVYDTLQFTAIGIYSDDSEYDLTDQVTWDSDDDEIATISNTEGNEGLAKAYSDGEVEISASFDGITETTTLTVEE